VERRWSLFPHNTLGGVFTYTAALYGGRRGEWNIIPWVANDGRGCRLKAVDTARISLSLQ